MYTHTHSTQTQATLETSQWHKKHGKQTHTHGDPDYLLTVPAFLRPWGVSGVRRCLRNNALLTIHNTHTQTNREMMYISADAYTAYSHHGSVCCLPKETCGRGEKVFKRTSSPELLKVFEYYFNYFIFAKDSRCYL